MSHYSTIPRGAAWATVLLLSVLCVVAYLDRLIFGLLIGGVKSELGLSDTQLGLLAGPAFAGFYVLFALPMSRIADRWDRRMLIVIAALLWNGMTAASAFAPNYPTLVLLRIGVALGEAALVPSAMSMIGDLFERDSRTRPLSIFVGAGSLGTGGSLVFGAAVMQLAASPMVSSLPWIGAMPSWRLTLLLLGVPGLILVCVFAVLAKEPRRLVQKGTDEASVRDVARHMLEHVGAYAAVIMTACMIGLLTFAMLTWYPTYLVRNFGWEISQAGYAFGLVGLFVTPFAVVAGPALLTIIHRWRRDEGFIWIAIVGVLLVGGLIVASMSAPTARASVALAAPAYFVILTVGNLSVITMPLLPPASMRGQAMAVYMFIAGLFGLGLGPLIVAIISERFFPGDAGLGKALAAVAWVVAPVLVLGLLATRKRFVAGMRAAAEGERAALLAS